MENNNQKFIEDLLNKYSIVSKMINKDQLNIVLSNLITVINNNIEGDVVELGCNQGTTSLFIRRALNHCKSKKKYHVYDSFEGLPNKKIQDESREERQFEKGMAKASKRNILRHFDEANLKLPIIHEG